MARPKRRRFECAKYWAFHGSPALSRTCRADGAAVTTHVLRVKARKKDRFDRLIGPFRVEFCEVLRGSRGFACTRHGSYKSIAAAKAAAMKLVGKKK